MRLKDKVAIITGAGQGLGREFALRFAREGAHVVIAEVVVDKAHQVEQEIKTFGGKALALRTDVTSAPDTETMAKTVAEKLGGIDILVNNAALYGGLPAKRWDAWTREEWQQSLEINVLGTWHCTKAVAPFMKKRGQGKIINLSSATVEMGLPALLPYTCTKGAIVAMTRAIARSLGRHNINVNCLSPGYTLSEGSLKRPGRTEETDRALIQGRCFRRHEYPEDIVGAVLFFASEESDFITGQNLLVDGGEVMH